MKALRQHCGVAAPLLRSNIDTDAIIPSREMKRVSKVGLGDGLFAGERYLAQAGREPNPEFILNHPDYAGASILLTGDNFGCGSSREHAVWALREFGIRVIIAPGFGTIFANNCIRNGLLPLVLPEERVLAIAQWVREDPRHRQPLIDLEACQLRAGLLCFEFSVEEGARKMLLEGLDAIELTLTRREEIESFHKRRKRQRPWLYA